MNFPKGLVSKLWPAAAVAVLFLVVSAAYFAPQFRGEVLEQHDVVQYEGMTRDIVQARQQYGEDPQWTGGMFGGMPAYLINVAYPAQAVKGTVGQVVKVLDTPAAFLFFAMAAMWLMLLMAGFDPWAAVVPALAYGFSTYFILIISAGHITKMWALVYAPLMMGGAWMTLRGKNIWYGAALTALSASLEIGANHPQIAYYFLLALGAFWLSEAVAAVRAQRLRDFGLRTAALAAAGLLAVASNFAPLWYTAQHSPETIRGGSELAEATEKETGGLDLDYATAWSYGRAETLNLLVPDFMGRDSSTTFPTDGAVAAATDKLGWYGAAQQLPVYWGTQPYTGGPTYLGAAAIFLAALGIALTCGRNKWWIIAVSVAAVFLSWGHNWMGLTEFLFRHLPGYNKFRTVSMTLVVVQWTVPLLGGLGLMQLWRGEVSREKLLRALGWSAGITGGLCLLLAVAGGGIFDFGYSESSAMITRLFAANGLPEAWALKVSEAMTADRVAMMRSDAWRSLAMIVLAAGAVLLFALRKVNRYGLAALLAGIVLLDLVPVDLRFLSSDDFMTAPRRRVQATAADRAIMADTEPGFRVINLTVSPFNDATTSLFHRSVGGYHGAKLSRYQDLIDRYLSNLDENVLDMLDTRYAIVPGDNGQPEARRRGTEYGAAWLVDTLVWLPDARAEIEALGETDLRVAAVASPVRGHDALRPEGPFAPGEIELTEYRPNYLRYEYTAAGEALAVFSEIYYDKGWKAYVDGAETPYLRVDYVLRGMVLPAGVHTVEWRFRAPGWGWTEAITLTASIAILAGALAALLHWLRKTWCEVRGGV